MRIILSHLPVLCVSLLALTTASPVFAQAVTPEIQARINALQAQIDAQQALLDELKAQLGAKPTAPNTASVPTQIAVPVAALTKAPTKPSAPATSLSLKNGAPTFATNDGAFSLTLSGVIQADAGGYNQDNNLPSAITGAARDLNSGTNFRRARFGFSGKLYSDFDYNMVFDFGGAGAEDVGRVHEAWIQYSGFKDANIRIGEFAPSAGLADSGSANGSPFLERASASEIARGLGGGDTRMGVAVFKAYDRWLYSLALTGNTVSSLNTQASGFNAHQYDEQTGFVARLAGTPYKTKNALIHIGLNHSAILKPADAGITASTRYAVQLRDRPELRVDGTRLIDTGAMDADSASATGIELAAQYKTLYMSSESFTYNLKRRNAASGVTNPDFSGWYVEGGWVLTGETRKYSADKAAFSGITPTHMFDPKNNHWGAFELVGRYSTIDLNFHENAALAADRVRGGQQDISSLGLNWQLNPNVRFVFEGQDVKIERMNSAGDQIGQDYTSFAVRSQFNY
ncbi:MAG: porin [Asticcacaulis sp.]